MTPVEEAVNIGPVPELHAAARARTALPGLLVRYAVRGKLCDTP
jgi:hypothetical protein